jgi:hypothetical protein
MTMRSCQRIVRWGEWIIIRDPGSGIRDPGSGIRDPGSGIRDPGSGIRDPGSEDENPMTRSVKRFGFERQHASNLLMPAWHRYFRVSRMGF